jgi:hypothetical protein
MMRAGQTQRTPIVYHASFLRITALVLVLAAVAGLPRTGAQAAKQVPQAEPIGDWRWVSPGQAVPVYDDWDHSAHLVGYAAAGCKLWVARRLELSSGAALAEISEWNGKENLYVNERDLTREAPSGPETPTPGYSFFLQTDERWAKARYAGGTLRTFSKGGCGVFAVKNALRARGIDIPILELDAMAVVSGARSGAATSVSTLLQYIGRFYPNITFRRTDDVAEVKQHLANGGVAIVNVISYTGHYMAIVGYDPGREKFLVQDSAPGDHRNGRGEKEDPDGSYIGPKYLDIDGTPDQYLLIP